MLHKITYGLTIERIQSIIVIQKKRQLKTEYVRLYNIFRDISDPLARVDIYEVVFFLLLRLILIVNLQVVNNFFKKRRNFGAHFIKKNVV